MKDHQKKRLKLRQKLLLKQKKKDVEKKDFKRRKMLLGLHSKIY